MKIKNLLKNSWKWSKKLYLGLYLAVSAHVAYDFLAHNLPRLDRGETVQILEVHRYKINIDGEEKKLTLVGENHNYNKNENKLAQKIVDEHKYFADECGSNPLNNISLKNLAYGFAISIPLSINEFYRHLGNGRVYDSIDEIAERKGYIISPLEKPEDPFNNLSLVEKTRIFGELVFSALTAPLAYYPAKNEAAYNASEFANFKYRESLIDKRDKVMAQGIISLLRKKEIDKLLAEVGIGHLEGIILNLSKKVQLIEDKG